jgi:hypothetical protein
LTLQSGIFCYPAPAWDASMYQPRSRLVSPRAMHVLMFLICPPYAGGSCTGSFGRAVKVDVVQPARWSPRTHLDLDQGAKRCLTAQEP